ncbi:MAG: TIGR02680 family protein [Clostridia bacterium]|nr:TIGR02680 family protein [Clostridia bacterium]
MSEWVINKIGLINFWYYDEEEFEFSDGRLLLRGSNGSGKSVTMQSFIPLLLDGNRSAKRLDPFGTNSRKIENYLLMDGDNRDENTGYLYMEFVKPRSGNYLTIGIGLRARRGKPVEFWGFSITDGKRIGKDFYLYKEMGDKIPLTKRELKNRILDNGIGEFCERAADYKAMVNNYIFGFNDVAEYEQLIDLLVQLRSPKLSKDYKPTVLYEIMEESLKPLSDEDLRPMSEAIENMDNIEASIAALKAASDSANRLRTIYDKYNSGVLYYKAEAFINALNSLHELQKQASDLTADIARNEETIVRESNTIETLNQRKTQLDDKLQKYKETDIYKLNQRIMELEGEIDKEKENLKDKEHRKDQCEYAKRQSEIKLEENKNEYELKESEFSKTLSDMTDYAEEAAFGEHKFFVEEIIGSEDFEFSDINVSVKNYINGLKRVIECFKSVEAAEKEYDSLNEQHSKEKARYDEISSEIKKAENTFNEEKSAFVEKLYAWNKSNEYLMMSDEALQRTSQAVYAFEDFADSTAARTEIEKAYGDKKSDCNTRIKLIDNKLDSLEKEMDELNKKILEIQSQPEIAPELTEEQESFRRELDKHKIPYIPLYRACDFDADTTEEERAVIEEALWEMGLLNSLIIPKRYRSELPVSDGAADKFIVPINNDGDTSIAIPLCAEKNTDIPTADIEDALAGITDGDGELYIKCDGSYGISILNGFTSGKRPSRYIGAESRRRHKEEILKQLNSDVYALEKDYNRLGEEEKALKYELEIMHDEYNNAPSTEDITEALSILKNLHIKEENCAGELERLKDEVNKAFCKLNERQMTLGKNCEQFDLHKSIEAYQNADDYMEDYRSSLNILIAVYKDMCICTSNIRNLNEKIEELGYQIDDLFVDIRDIKLSLNKAKGEKENCEEIKRKNGFENTEREIESMQRELDEIPRKLRDSQRLIDKSELNNDNNKKELEAVNIKLAEAELECGYCETVFSEELELGYNDIKADNLIKAAETAARNRPDKSLSDLRIRLSQKYYEEKVELTDYSVTENECFTDMEQRGTVDRVRIRLMARVRGTETDFYALIEYLEREIRENEELLTQKDKELFEDLLIDTVGRKMRARISNSERWVEEMNKKMISMDTSSGLSFSLEWKSKPADSEDQLNTKELVALLRTDSKILTDENIERISKHFRSKLKAARLRRDESDDAESMHTILKEILDYRKWFEFRLFYRMTGDQKKELTNTAFYRFSGGEKAMAMYVPLFASVYARYAKASAEAPKLISLDEAFAGIDDKNIADMFRIMEELKLSYIINSQVLWGTYSTVPSLSICELIRPNNADTVSVVRYKWNGKNKELVV